MHLKINIKFIFIFIFFTLGIYVLLIKTEKFESKSIVMIKDLSQKQSVSALGSMFLSQGAGVMEDSKLLELYIRSEKMFKELEQQFNLLNYYTGKEVDFIQRLSENAFFPPFEANQKNLIENYNQDLSIFYDEPSATLEISFAHADAKVAQEIVKGIIQYSQETLNNFEKKNAQVALHFLSEQEKENKTLFIRSIKKLISYQNRHDTIDPSIDVQSKSAILANLESELIQKEVEYKSKLQFMNKNTPEMNLLRGNLVNIQEGITKLKNKISGGDGNDELNSDVFEFELLKSEVDFNKERYKQTLIKLEETKISVNQNVKNIIIVTPAYEADTYSYPEKFKEIFSLLIIFSFLYGIITLVLSILKDHKD